MNMVVKNDEFLVGFKNNSAKLHKFGKMHTINEA